MEQDSLQQLAVLKVISRKDAGRTELPASVAKIFGVQAKSARQWFPLMLALD
jgi:hypothetical protein